MPGYGYIRISRDEDGKRESIENQRKVINGYAQDSGIELIHVFEDNNVSGYTMDRPEFNKLKELINAGQVDILLCKDLSRLGRHNANVLLFLEYLEEHKVRLLLKGDNYDSENGNNDLLGVKAWYNEMYIKDLSRKITTNMRQKQKDGLVITHHFGYRKDPSQKNKLLIDEEAADTVRLIFSLYLQGHGTDSIAQYLNERGIITPSMYKQEKDGYGWKPTWQFKHLWQSSCVSRILKNDAYIGTLRCGVTRVSKMKGKQTRVHESQQHVHENFMEPIITKEDFALAQAIRMTRSVGKARTGRGKIHRYAGLLRCTECGGGFHTRRSPTKQAPSRVAYVCASYNLYGNTVCNAHLLYEHELDSTIFEKLESVMHNGLLRLSEIEQCVDQRKNSRDGFVSQMARIEAEMTERRDEIKEYARQLAQQRIDNSLFDELTQEAQVALNGLQLRLNEIRDRIKCIDGEPSVIRRCLERLEDIIEQRTLSNADITMLINSIRVTETDSCFTLDIVWNVAFMDELEAALRQAS